MTIDDRIEVLLQAKAAHPFLGEVTRESLTQWIRLELGGLPEQWRPYGSSHLRCLPYSPILHVVSSNTTHAAIQTLARGILAGAINRMKIPSPGLPEFDQVIEQLPPDCRPETSLELPDEWLATAEAVVVFGSDETIRHFLQRIRPGQHFLGHGHKISLGLIVGDHTSDLAERAAQDTILFDQTGCLSPQFFLVKNQPEQFASRLALALESLQGSKPPSPLNVEIATRLRSFREDWRFRASLNRGVQVFESNRSLDWTVVYDPHPALSSSPLYRTIFVKPFHEELNQTLGPVRKWISTIGIDRVTEETANLAVALGAQRVCPIGRMQFPPLTWHHDGWPTLSSLMKFVDLEGLPFSAPSPRLV